MWVVLDTQGALLGGTNTELPGPQFYRWKIRGNWIITKQLKFEEKKYQVATKSVLQKYKSTNSLFVEKKEQNIKTNFNFWIRDECIQCPTDQLHWEKHEDPNLGGDVSRPENLDVTPMPTNKLEPQETIGIL